MLDSHSIYVIANDEDTETSAVSSDHDATITSSSATTSKSANDMEITDHPMRFVNIMAGDVDQHTVSLRTCALAPRGDK